MEQYRSYTDPHDENDVTNKRYVDNNVHNIDKKIDEQIEKVENDIDDRFKKSLGNIIVDSIKNKNIFNVGFALLFYRELCNARIIEDGIRLISNSDTTNNVYAIYRTIDLRGLEGKQLVLSYKTRSNKSVTSSLGGIELFYENAAGNDRTLIEWNATNGFSFQVKDNLENNYYLAITFFANRSGNQIYNNEYVDYYDIQIEKGDVPTTFVPYKRYGYNSQESMGSIVVDDISCKNKFNISSVTWGRYAVTTDGTSIEEGEFANSFKGYVENIVAGETISISANYSTTFRFSYIFLDSSNNVLGGAYVSEAKISHVFNGLIVPANATKLLISQLDVAQGNDIKIQVEKGTVATNYSEYKGIGYTNGKKNGVNWVKYDDGRMELWGEVTMLANNGNVVINFPFSFNSPNDYSIFATPGYNYHNDVICTWADKGWSSCRIFAVRSDRSIIGYDQNIDFQIKGYWK